MYRPTLDRSVIVFIEDILVYFKTQEQHEEHLREFLGYLVNRMGFLVDPAKIEAMMQWEVPRSPSEIWSFLGLAGYYRRFIQNFSKITVPLTRLTKNLVTFSWGPEQQTTFETLRQRLCDAPILTLPEGVDDFVVYCDASIIDVVNDYNYEILYHPGKVNVVADALSHKAVATSIQDICLRTTVITPLLEQIREAQVEGMKEEHQKCELIVGQVASFDYNNCGLLTLHQRGMILLWDVDAGLAQIDKYFHSNDNHVIAGASLEDGVVKCGIKNDCDPALALFVDYLDTEDASSETWSKHALG
uniref:Reverse transcriptase/retrotransposon-derived protein RNase H-like domain-containing protein n=1 Tax=Lactuca sativa TaxID=4236 RepID=A0A9R1VQJ8_LACSA|nr:hypothetical protein LSAT_V11C400211960 [Lactuca sativa]